jgi:ElaB/YqjD/DUF883 family membrane-anchored ribosome-binding protein
MDLQKTVGKLNEAVDTLKTQSAEVTKKLDGISHKIYAAIAVLTVVGGLIGFLINKGLDLLIQIKGTH